MRAHEFITEGKSRRPEISLRHLNHLKHMGTSKNDAVGVKLDVSRGLPDRGQA